MKILLPLILTCIILNAECRNPTNAIIETKKINKNYSSNEARLANELEKLLNNINATLQLEQITLALKQQQHSTEINQLLELRELQVKIKKLRNIIEAE